MLYRVLADLVMLTHAAFVLFVLLGGLLAVRWPRAAWVHLPAAAWGAAVEFFGWFCPLTPLEYSLRRLGGSAGSSGSFVANHVLPIIYPAELTRELQLLLGSAVVVLNIGVYFLVWRRSRGIVVRA